MAGAVLLLLGPALRSGYLLVVDMVFVPEWTWDGRLFGLDAVAPRAVPSDLVAAAVAALTRGDVAQKIILAATLLGAGWGAQRLLPSDAVLGRVAAGLFYLWNPFVHQRLSMGHWPILVSYAALPWVVHQARRVAGGDRAGWPPLVLALAVAGVSGPFGALVGASLALAMLPRLRVVVATVAVNLTWLVPALLLPGGVPSRPAAIGAFAANPDTPLGVWGSLATLGGIWNRLVVGPERGSWWWVPLWAAVLTVAVGGLRELHRRWGAQALGLTGVALGWFFLAGAATVPGLASWLEWIAGLPGGGFLRDAQKFVAPLALVWAMGLGLGVTMLISRSRLAGVLLALAPLVLTPSLAWGVGGRLDPVSYPADWHRAAEVIAADEVPGEILVLPWRLYRAFSWNPASVVLDPAQRFFPRRAVLNDALVIGDLVIDGEDPVSARLGPVVEQDPIDVDRLRAAGIRWVLSHGGPAPFSTVGPVLAGPTLHLYRIPDPSPPLRPTAPVVPVALGHLVALGTVAAAASTWVRMAVESRT